MRRVIPIAIAGVPTARLAAVALTLALFAGAADAQGIAGVARPTILSAIVIGLLTGAITGSIGLRLETGLAISIGTLLPVIIGMIFFFGGEQVWLNFVLVAFLAAIFGAIPLLVAFLVTYALCSWLRKIVRRVRDVASP